MSEFGQSIIKAVREAADQRLDYVYPGGQCVYVSDGKPACLLGNALWNMALIGPELEQRHELNNEGIDSLLAYLAIDIDDPERQWLEIVQGGQDALHPWGEAVQFADDWEDDLVPL